jgi:hypothetical protein
MAAELMLPNSRRALLRSLQTVTNKDPAGYALRRGCFVKYERPCEHATLKDIAMNEIQSTSRIHPLIGAAAVSVTLVSLLGMAAITGVLPSSHGITSQNSSDSALESFRVPTGQEPRIDSARFDTTHKVIHLEPQIQHAHPPQSSTQYADSSGVRTPPPAPQQERSTKPAVTNSAVGIGIGALIGGVLGNQVGSGDGKTLATIAGAIGGGYVGNEVAKKNQ